MSDRYTDRLSDYLDEELDESERLEIETHLRECPACVSTLEELRLVVARATRLTDGDRLAAAPDLWPGIEARLEPRPHVLPFGRPASARSARSAGSGDRPRGAFSWVQLAAACLVTAVLSGTAVWFAEGPRRRPTSPAS